MIFNYRCYKRRYTTENLDICKILQQCDQRLFSKSECNPFHPLYPLLRVQTSATPRIDTERFKNCFSINPACAHNWMCEVKNFRPEKMPCDKIIINLERFRAMREYQTSVLTHWLHYRSVNTARHISRNRPHSVNNIGGGRGGARGGGGGACPPPPHFFADGIFFTCERPAFQTKSRKQMQTCSQYSIWFIQYLFICDRS